MTWGDRASRKWVVYFTRNIWLVFQACITKFFKLIDLNKIKFNKILTHENISGSLDFHNLRSARISQKPLSPS